MEVFKRVLKTYNKICYNNCWRLIRAYIYFLLSILTVFSAYSGWCYYGDDPAAWFGRSGAIVTLWAAMGESLLAAFGIGSIIQGISERNTAAFRRRNDALIRLGQLFGGVLIVLGTLIWAYGDLLYISLSVHT